MGYATSVTQSENDASVFLTPTSEQEYSKAILQSCLELQIRDEVERPRLHQGGIAADSECRGGVSDLLAARFPNKRAARARTRHRHPDCDLIPKSQKVESQFLG